ncbi:MAG: serine protease [Burkholderiales bacterium]|nr:serine protease [Burkholderiales bacterium]
MSPKGRPEGEYPSAQREGTPVSATRTRIPAEPGRIARAAAALALLALAVAVPAAWGQTKLADAPPSAAGIDATQIFGAIVKVNANAVPDARSAASLGSEREGSGVVIGDNGLILTIGYLIVEAEDVSVVDSKGRTLAARVVGYDHATGFALLRTIAPLDAKPVALGESGKIAERQPVMIASSGDDNVSFAFVVSRRGFSGNWEYALDQAIYTSPPTLNWSGAALFDRDGKLLGVGSLIVRDATDEEPRLPGNMFVPIDLLKPILADMVSSGRRAGPPRPWLGIATDELQGRLVVTRVSPDGPAERAGVKAGDIVLAVGGEPVRTQPEFYRKVWARGGAGTSIPLNLLQGVDLRDLRVESIDRVEYFKPPTTH